MAFKASERLPIWQNLNAKARARLAAVDTDYPGIDESLKARIRAGEQESVNMTQGFVDLYTKDD